MRVVNSKIWWIFSLISGILIISTFLKWISISPTETLGFITGAICVLLVIDQNIWNFPIGIINNIFFIILFYSARLYGDMGLQFIYIILAWIGWWQWLYGGVNHSKLKVTRSSFKEILLLVFIGIFSTLGLRLYFIEINDSVPFLDALTTVLSLLAQYLLNGKRLQNWYFWIIADIIYIGLYIYKELYLTALLYAIFIAFCIAGYITWRKSEIEILKVVHSE